MAASYIFFLGLKLLQRKSFWILDIQGYGSLVQQLLFQLLVAFHWYFSSALPHKLVHDRLKESNTMSLSKYF